jgi:hypothetical protein
MSVEREVQETLARYVRADARDGAAVADHFSRIGASSSLAASARHCSAVRREAAAQRLRPKKHYRKWFLEPRWMRRVVVHGCASAARLRAARHQTLVTPEDHYLVCLW